MITDMTKGPPAKLMIAFTLPMFLGNLFQQLYNVVDTIIVGKFVGKIALAAVGSSFAIMILVNSIIIGLSMGASVLFSQLFGAKDYKRLKVALAMATVFILGFTLLLSIATFLWTDSIISAYKMPAETVKYARDYLKWIFGGMIFVGIFTFSASVLRSFGDSKTPLYFLVLASGLNIALDLYLIIQLNMEVLGAAIATVVAQAVAGVACGIFAWKKIRFLKFEKSDLHYDSQLFKTMSSYAFLTGIQQSVMNFGIVLIQGLVNTFGAILMAAFSAGVKVDAFAYMPTQDLGNAFSIYTAQNVGAKKADRIKRGLKVTAFITGSFACLVSIFVFFYAENLIGLFVKAEEIEVISLGAQYLRIEGVFYVLIAFLFMFYGFYRGLGHPNMSIILTIVSLGTRVLISYLLAPKYGFIVIFWAIPIGWFLADLVGWVFWHMKKNQFLKWLPL